VEEFMRGIGQMARECGLTVSALRFYDGAGVLVPARVDPHTGYRWYSDDQMLVARLIARLRRVGMPLADIGRVLEHRDSRSVVDQILDRHLACLEAGLAEARHELSAARSLLTEESPVTTTITTTAQAFAATLNAVRYAVSTNPDLPMLGGILLEIGDDVRMVASDRYRLAVATLDGATVDGGPAGALMPTDLLDAALAAADEAGGPVDLTLDGDRITIVAGGRSLHRAPLPHDFPPYRRLLAGGGPAHRVEVDAATLRSELSTARPRIVPTEGGGTQPASVLTVTSAGSVTFAPEDAGVFEVGLNPEFLLQALDAAESGPLVLELDGPLTPLAVRGFRSALDVALLMPIRLG
jgi:DNA-binding transcriptional MerR regulator